MKTYQVTIGAAATQFSTTNISVRQVIVQNNGSNTMRIGDAAVSTTRGAKLLAGGSLNLGPFTDHPEDLKNWWVAGTQNDVVDIIITG